MAVTRLSAYAVVPTIVMTDRDLTCGAREKPPVRWLSRAAVTWIVE